MARIVLMKYKAKIRGYSSWSEILGGCVARERPAALNHGIWWSRPIVTG